LYISIFTFTKTPAYFVDFVVQLVPIWYYKLEVVLAQQGSNLWIKQTFLISIV
jgi:hypothetical protein